MKLVHNSFTFAIEFEENIVNLIVVENKSYLRQLVKELCDAEKGSDPLRFERRVNRTER